MANPTKTWALLIGIDAYPDPRNRLSGCVNDVEDVELLLKIRLLNVAITKLTASVPTEGDKSLPSEHESDLPTMSNVTSQFALITDSALGGDNIYIHYSGHGTRLKTTSAYSNKSSAKDAALCLYRLGGENSYLTGFELAQMLDKMADKGLTVTVVLDCCCSGSVTRKGAQDGTSIRGMEWDPSIYVPPISAATRGDTRDSDLARHWLLDPKQYALLAACGPQELAKEAKLDGKRRGVLTYNMISLLALPRNQKTNLTFPDLFNQLVAKMHVEAPMQNPMRFGKTEAVFCCPANLQARIDPSVIGILDSGFIRLNVGRVHGASYDDEYAVHPQQQGTAGENTPDLPSIRFKIVSVNDVNSIASPLSNGVDDLTEFKAKIAIGCRAEPLTHFSLRRTHVKVPSDFLEMQRAVQGFTPLTLIENESTDCPTLYTVEINSKEEYQVDNAAGEPLSHVPTVPIIANNAKQEVVDIVEHIAKFKFIEGLVNKNPSSTFENSFEIWIGQNGIKFPDKPDGVITVQDGKRIDISIKNNGHEALYFSLLNLRPLWDIEPILMQAEGLQYIEPGTEPRTIGFQMMIPQELKDKGQKCISEILKVFITRKLARLDVLAMRPLGGGPGFGGHRGDEANLDDVLSVWPASQRNAVAVSHEDLWIARNFIIRTTLD